MELGFQRCVTDIYALFTVFIVSGTYEHVIRFNIGASDDDISLAVSGGCSQCHIDIYYSDRSLAIHDRDG